MKKFICFTGAGIKPQEVFATNLRSAKTIYRDLYNQFAKARDVHGYDVAKEARAAARR